MVMIKDVLVNLDSEADHDPARDYAISVAREFGAHLTGIAFNREVGIPGSVFDGGVASAVAAYRAQNKKRAQSANEKFESAARDAGVMAEVHIIGAGAVDAGSVFGKTARNYDLSIVGQVRPDSEAMEELIVEGALFGSGRPVLIVPYIHRTGFKVDRVMICWNGSRNVARAVADAMPILRRAGAIDIVSIQPQKRTGDVAGTDIAQHLARHALKVEVKQIVGADIDVTNMILSYASDASTDLIVMGGYGHSRLREFILGGATRGILESMTVPTLMAH
jgi:nucleotide-binding universal stress UspA family protein